MSNVAAGRDALMLVQETADILADAFAFPILLPAQTETGPNKWPVTLSLQTGAADSWGGQNLASNTTQSPSHEMHPTKRATQLDQPQSSSLIRGRGDPRFSKAHLQNDVEARAPATRL